jgi:aryl carrier-like protein
VTAALRAVRMRWREQGGALNLATLAAIIDRLDV